ncbi:MAG: hypothetical protein IPJ77_11220 [Planctomycetes bacterium]|nr:hypothetical protein [Planctomycetota bacterium]
MTKHARPERTQRTTRASGGARTSQHPDAVRAAKRAARTKTTGLTLGELADRYLRHLEARGATLSTRFSYHLELGVALDVLGRHTPVSDLTPERLAAFYTCDRVTKTRTGAPKARVSVEKTRRVVRQAVGWNRSVSCF